MNTLKIEQTTKRTKDQTIMSFFV